eukprot:XP_001693112.1 predicted protein [Chlamydomonas reinhardtii]
MLAGRGADLHLGLLIMAAGQWDVATWLVDTLPDGEPQLHWDVAFFALAKRGAPLALLQRLHERRGTAVDRVAMADGGSSNDALAWADERLAAGARGGLGLDPAVETDSPHWVEAQLLRAC